MPAHGIMFHHFHSSLHTGGQGSISAEQLSDMIEFLGVKNFLPAQDWLDRALKNKLEDSDICITFDDALLCQYDVAWPVLKSYGLSGFWFIYSAPFNGTVIPMEVYRYFRTQYFATIDEFYETFEMAVAASFYGAEVAEHLVGHSFNEYLALYPFYSENDAWFRYVRDRILGHDRYEEIMDALMISFNVNTDDVLDRLWLNNEHLKVLERTGNVLGLHSNTHPIPIASSPVEVQQQEYLENFNHLSSVVDAPILTVGHPGNSYNDDTLKILRDLGIKVGFCANMTPIGNSDLEFPREDHANIVRRMKN